MIQTHRPQKRTWVGSVLLGSIAMFAASPSMSAAEWD